MTRSASPAFLGNEFDHFLFAPVGEDGNGTMLNVLSALARLDVDPWLEAIALSVLPEKTATVRLISLIAALPDVPAARQDPETIAARLIARLPSRVNVGIPIPGKLRVIRGLPRKRTVLIAAVVVLIHGAQYFLSIRQPPAEFELARPPVSGTPSPNLQPSDARQ